MTDENTLYGVYSELHAMAGGNLGELRVLLNPLEGWIGVGLLLLFALSFRYIVRFFEVSFQGLLHFHVAQKQFEESSLLIAYIRRMLLFFSLGCISFFLFLVVRYYDGFPEHLSLVQVYFLFLALLLGFYIVKSTLLRAIGFFTETENAMRMMGYYGQLYVISVGILLFPVVILFFNEQASFCSLLVTIGLIASLGVLLLYVVRSFQIFLSSRISIFFWILYLCTFEIAPFLFIYKYISLV